MLPMSYTFSLMAHGTQTHWLSVSLTFFGRTIPAFVAFIFIFHAIICTKVYWICFFLFILAFGWRAYSDQPERKFNECEIYRFWIKILFFAFSFFFCFGLAFSLRRSFERYVFYFYLRRVCVCQRLCVCVRQNHWNGKLRIPIFIYFLCLKWTHTISSRERANGMRKKNGYPWDRI